MTSAPFTGSGERKAAYQTHQSTELMLRCYVLLHIGYQFTVNANVLFEAKMITGVCIANIEPVEVQNKAYVE